MSVFSLWVRHYDCHQPDGSFKLTNDLLRMCLYGWRNLGLGLSTDVGEFANVWNSLSSLLIIHRVSEGISSGCIAVLLFHHVLQAYQREQHWKQHVLDYEVVGSWGDGVRIYNYSFHLTHFRIWIQQLAAFTGNDETERIRCLFWTRELCLNKRGNGDSKWHFPVRTCGLWVQRTRSVCTSLTVWYQIVCHALLPSHDH